MALKYKNQVTGRVQEMLEPTELAEHLAGVTRRGRPMDPKRIGLAKKRRQRLLVKMNDSWKWQRTDVGTTEPEPDGDADEEETSEEPKAADVRAWAKTEGLDVPARGKLSPEVVEQFKAASEGW